MKKNKKNKMKSKKVLVLIFVGVLMVSTLCGMVVGSLSAKASNNASVTVLLEQLKADFYKNIPYFYAVVALASILIPLLLYLPCQRMYREYMKDRSNEELLDRLEIRMNGPLFWNSMFTIIHLFFFFVFLDATLIMNYVHINWVVFLNALLCICSLASQMVIPGRIVKIEKELNPEKRGDVMDFQFQKVWVDSCDEAQKMMIFQAGFAAFRRTNQACMIFMLITMVAMFSLRAGVLPMLCVCCIWIVNNASYMIKAVKLERGDKEYT